MLNPRYHSTCGKEYSATFQAPTSLLPLRSITEGIYLPELKLRGFRSSDSEVIGHPERFSIASHQPATLCRVNIPTVFVTVVICFVQLLNAVYTLQIHLSIVFAKIGSTIYSSKQQVMCRPGICIANKVTADRTGEIRVPLILIPNRLFYP